MNRVVITGLGAVSALGLDVRTHSEALRAGRCGIGPLRNIVTEGLVTKVSAVVIGAGVGGQSTLDENYYRVYGQNAKRLHPFTIPKLMISAAASHITIE